MIEIVNIFSTTIINKSLLISFIFSRSKDFTVIIENDRLDYFQNNWGNKDFISIN